MDRGKPFETKVREKGIWGGDAGFLDFWIFGFLDFSSLTRQHCMSDV